VDDWKSLLVHEMAHRYSGNAPVIGLIHAPKIGIISGEQSAISAEEACAEE
jgi:hypothetical protein